MNFIRIYHGIAFHENKNLPPILMGVSIPYLPNNSSRNSHELK